MATKRTADKETVADDTLRELQERAERAEAELAELKHQQRVPAAMTQTESLQADGEEELRKDSMMAHLLDSLSEGKDIGHYGRLVFAMVARHFLSPEEVIARLTNDRDFSEEEAHALVRQVEGRDYNPPKRERILEWQAEQSFPILPYPEDPDCGNLYRNLKFPDSIYKNIEHYQEAKADAEEAVADEQR